MNVKTKKCYKSVVDGFALVCSGSVTAFVVRSDQGGLRRRRIVVAGTREWSFASVTLLCRPLVVAVLQGVRIGADNLLVWKCVAVSQHAHRIF